MRPIAITRIAVHSALGNSLDETVRALRAGSVGVRTPVDLEQTPRIDSGAGEVPLPADARGPWRAETIMRRTLASLLSQADRDAIAREPDRWCAVIGTTLAGMRHCGTGMRDDEAGRLAQADAAYARSTASSVLAHALRDIGFEGPSLSVSCACASALSAVNHACSLLESGACDAAIAGGYDPIAEFAYGGFAALQLVAQGPLSPFAADREGMKLGEGAALFVLRRLSDIPPDERASVRAVIVAADESSDAHHLTQPHPAGDGASRVLRGVGASSAQVDLLVAHATGTPGNDSAEFEAYKSAFGAQLESTPVVALKSRFGHPLGAAGALELAAVLGCAESGFTPSSAGRGRDRESFPALDLVEGPVRDASPREIVALSAGFGGANAATRVSRTVPATVEPRRADSAIEPVAITAIGAVSPAGRGAAALVERSRDAAPWSEFDEAVLAPLVDRARSRRLGLLPRLMIGAVRDLVESSAMPADILRDTPLVAANWCGAADFTERYYRDLVRSGIDLANPMLFAESVPNIGSAQCSLAFGIRAPTISVIGRRTAALEALLLVQARMATGVWDRAIVVASEEAHPIVARVLERCSGGPVQQRSAAIAFLVERPRADRPACEIGAVVGRTSNIEARIPMIAWPDAPRGALDPRKSQTVCVTSGSPFDLAIRESPHALVRAFEPEIGAATPFAALLASTANTPATAAAWLAARDPHGACWTAAFADPAKCLNATRLW